MKKAFTYPFIFLITFFFTDLKSQTLKQSSGAGTDPEVKQAAIKANQKRIEKRKTQTNDITIPARVNPIDENDMYEGRKAEFLGNLTVSELPADFPTYDKSYGLKYYNNLVDNFYGSHKDILKPAVKQKLEQAYPSSPIQQSNTK